MKHSSRLLALAFVGVSASLAIAQKNGEFAGDLMTAWGGDRPSVQKFMGQMKVILTRDTALAKGSTLSYSGGSYIRHPIDAWDFGFKGTSLAYARATYSGISPTRTLGVYRDIERQLKAIYGAPFQSTDTTDMLETKATRPDYEVVEAIQRGEDARYAMWNITRNGVEWRVLYSITEDAELQLAFILAADLKR